MAERFAFSNDSIVFRPLLCNVTEFSYILATKKRKTSGSIRNFFQQVIIIPTNTDFIAYYTKKTSNKSN